MREDSFMEKSIFSKVYMWVFVGLLITFASGFFLSSNVNMLVLVFTTPLYWILPIAQILIAIFLPIRLMKMSQTTATILYLLYTLLTGLTFATIFIMYEMASIIFVFLISALLFLVFALIGRFTKIDITKIGNFLLMALIGIIVLNLINMFIMNGTLDIILCVVGLLIFLGYTAYDIQKIKRMNTYGMDSNKLAIIGAFDLYLDFINIFLKLLRLFGKSRD